MQTLAHCGMMTSVCHCAPSRCDPLMLKERVAEIGRIIVRLGCPDFIMFQVRCSCSSSGSRAGATALGVCCSRSSSPWARAMALDC